MQPIGAGPQVRLEALARDALRAHDVAPEAVLTLLNVSENATFAVDDPATGERSVLRLHRPGYHGRVAIESELAWIAALRADDVVTTPAVLPARDGALVVPARSGGDQRDAVRFAWAPGHEPVGLPGDFRRLGALTARLHEHARAWRRPAWFTRPRWDHATSVGPCGHWGRWQDGPGVGPAEHAVLARLENALRLRLAAFGPGPERFGLVHADLRSANLLARPDGGITVLDFDDCGFGWYLYDLGASLSFREDDPRAPELVDAWVEGYRTTGRLGPEEVAELPTFVLLRRLLLVAWIGSHAGTDLARSTGEAFTQATCALADQYLSGHG